MKKTIDTYEFIAAFERHGRASTFGGTAGLRALFHYLEELERDTGTEFELDVIALCCDFTHFTDLSDYNRQYGTDYGDVYDIEYLACTVDSSAFITYAH